jgi:hypothetical protein
MLESKRALVAEKDKHGAVRSVRLTLTPLSIAELGLRPGSYGVDWERIAPSSFGASAGLVYSHKRTYERQLAA